MVVRKTIGSESNLNSTNKVQQLELHSDYIRNARYNIERRCSAGEAMMVFSDHDAGDAQYAIYGQRLAC